MLGVVSKISFDVLGLTVIAWANSLGDLVADYSVAKQGFPKMALGAAIGGKSLINQMYLSLKSCVLGPVFNLMVGFGISFLFAKIQGKHVSVKMDKTLKTMLIALGASLFASIIILASQRFQARRFHSIILIVIYLIFLVFIILEETNVF